MNLLLDTHVFLWSLFDPDKLPDRVQAALNYPHNEVGVSAVTFWELSLKFTLGKLNLNNVMPHDLITAATRAGFAVLPLHPHVAANYYKLARSGHKDPFDRMLVWQAIQGEYHLVSGDKELKAYRPHGLKLFWLES